MKKFITLLILQLFIVFMGSIRPESFNDYYVGIGIGFLLAVNSGLLHYYYKKDKP